MENPLAICRLDKLSRDEDLQTKLAQTDWDLVVVDEAHKMSASFFGGEIKETKRYKLGKLLSHLARHFLLMRRRTTAKRKTSSSSWRCWTVIVSKVDFGTACTQLTYQT